MPHILSEVVRIGQSTRRLPAVIALDLWPPVIRMGTLIASSSGTGRQHGKIMTGQSAFTKEELVACGHGKLFGEGNARLPVDNMLMLDRITHISSAGGAFGKGEIIAELDIHPDLWFFDCHFPSDPVMPGCLGLDAMWQLVGFFLGWRGNPGRGRALGSGEVKFTGQILPSASKVVYNISMKRVIERKLVMGIADGSVSVDGREIYTANNLRVGLFTSTESF